MATSLPPGQRDCQFCGERTSRYLKACEHCNHILPAERDVATGCFFLVVAIVVASFLVNSMEHGFQTLRWIFR